MARQIMSEEEIRETKAAAEAKLSELQSERASLPAAIETLKSAMLEGKIDPATGLKEIEAKEERLTVIEMLAAQSEGDLLRAKIAESRAPISQLEADLETALDDEREAAEGVRTAQTRLDEAGRRVRLIQHNISDAERRAQAFEAELSKLRQTAARLVAA